MHMKKEELIVFPSVRQLLAAKQGGGTPAVAAFGSIANPIRVMMSEHDGEGERFRRISALSNHYAPPEDACNTYRAAYAALMAFEEDRSTVSLVVMRLKSKIWQRLRIVGRILCFSVVARMNTA